MTGARDVWQDREGLRGEQRGEVQRRAAQARRAESVGPQGAALIAELQRIQRAFDQEYRPWRPPQAEHPAHATARAGGPHPRPHPRMTRHGIIGRAFNACLRRFGVAAQTPSRTPAQAPAQVPAQTPVDASGGQAASPASREPTAPRRLPRQAADHAIAPQPAGNVRPLPTARSRPARAEHDAAPLRHMRPVRPTADMTPGSAPPIELRDARPAPAERGRVHEIPRSGEQRQPDRRAGVPAENKAAIGRLVTTSIGHAGTACAYLLGRGDGAADDADAADFVTRVRRSFERELRTGLRVLVLGVGLIGAWATLVPLASAVVAAGSLVVQSNVKKVQHPTGGIVAQIAAHDGMHVNAGDLLVRLDATQARANFEMVAKDLDEVRIRIARLVAERDGSDEPTLPPQLAGRSADAEVGARFASEKSLFTARATARKNQKDLLASRIVQLGQQIDGLQAQIKSNAAQVDLIAGELQGAQTLFAKGLAPITRINSLQREIARLQGERGQFQSSIAETQSKIGEAKLQIIRVDQDFRADVLKDLREAEGKEAELAERQVAAQDVRDRIDIRAPTSGIVHELAVHTIGGVIKAGDVVMEIVPDTGDLQVEARLSPKDIDQVKVGQSTLVRLSALSQRTTPQLGGIVSYVSADTTHDQQGNASYYTVRVTLPEEAHRRLAGLQLVSGMPAEIFVQTGSRTMMSYLLKPIADQLRRAFSER
jgi:HlyD family secretion protein